MLQLVTFTALGECELLSLDRCDVAVLASLAGLSGSRVNPADYAAAAVEAAASEAAAAEAAAAEAAVAEAATAEATAADATAAEGRYRRGQRGLWPSAEL